MTKRRGQPRWPQKLGRRAQRAMAELREGRRQAGGTKGGKPAAPAKRKVDSKGVKASGNGSSGRNGSPVDKTPAGAGAAKAKPHPRSRKKKKRK